MTNGRLKIMIENAKITRTIFPFKFFQSTFKNRSRTKKTFGKKNIKGLKDNTLTNKDFF